MESTVRAALSAINAKYTDAAKRDILTALATFRDLHPSSDSYTFPDGIRRQVVSLVGTVPVSYKGASYNIPVCLYLLDTHPYAAPLCFVRPTNEMTIKESQHVNSDGQIFLPFLSEWKFPNSDLSGLLQIMVLVFQDQCPVFARSSTATQGYGQSNPTPYPTGQGYSMPTPWGSSPGYPAAPSTYTQPPYPPQGQPSATPYPSYPPTSGAAASTNLSGSMGANTLNTMKASVISRISEIVKGRLQDKLGQTYAEVQSIRKTREDLLSGQEKLKIMLERINSEQANIDAATVDLAAKNQELDRILGASQSNGELCIDDCVDTTTPLYRQLVKCFVEDSAIEDTVYYLGQALKRGNIDLDVYLKQVRKLARKQFVLRATIQKCRSKAGLHV